MICDCISTAEGTQSSLESLKERPMLPLVTSESLISCMIIFTRTPAELLGGGGLSKVATNKFLEVNLKVTMLWSFITAKETYEAVSEKLKIHYLAF